MKTTMGYAVAIVAAVLFIGLAVIGGLHLLAGDVNGRGGTSNGDSFSLGSNLNVGGTLVLGTNGGNVGDVGYNNGVGRNEQFGYCTAQASTTLCTITNPFSATSTFTINSFLVSGTQPTSTSFIIGTSTKVAANTSADVSTVGGSFSVGSSTTLYLVPSAGSYNPTTGSLGLRVFTVGPNERIMVWATSTATGVGAVNYNSALNTVTMKGTWTN